MEKITYTYARQNLSAILNTIIDDAEVLYIKRPKGDEVAMVNAKEYESLLETAHIFSTKASLLNRAKTDAEKRRKGN
jgi:PHD/YefM family antitoxin component YafN of YafNO toxin-antitoxin module